MGKRTLLPAIGLMTASCVIGCGPSPALSPRPPSNVERVRIVESCPCDDDEDDDDDDALDEAPPRKPVEYVRLDEWVPPPSVRAVESRIVPRGDVEPNYIRLPALTLHRPIAPSTVVWPRAYYSRHGWR